MDGGILKASHLLFSGRSNCYPGMLLYWQALTKFSNHEYENKFPLVSTPGQIRPLGSEASLLQARVNVVCDSSCCKRRLKRDTVVIHLQPGEGAENSPSGPADDRLRQPVFLGLREDKNANEVVRELAVAN
jgi:hypothetical protein